MIEDIKRDYERERMNRYTGISTDNNYDFETLCNALERWASAPGNRNSEWDQYCDIRDCVPIGTNHDIRLSIFSRRIH